MKIYRPWLQKFFDAELPYSSKIADALTFHAFEIESVENDVLDVKVTANRGHDALSHRGIAKELSAILDIPLTHDPLAEKPILSIHDDSLTVFVTTELCPRYIAGHIKGVKVKEPPDWLRQCLEAIGQRSINNVVDATNFIMFKIGQPLHAFDAAKLKIENGKLKIGVRNAKAGEKMSALDDKEYTLGVTDLVIVDGSDEVIGIAGVKGGKATGIDEHTHEIIVESANFDGVAVRKTAQSLKLRTDASSRFEQGLAPTLAEYGMSEVCDLIVKVAGGEIVGFVDEYQKMQKKQEVSVSLEKVNSVLGTDLDSEDVTDVFKALGLPFVEKDGSFIVTPPFERLDINIPEDLIEEIGRIVGYETIPEIALPMHLDPVILNPNFYSAELIREELVSQGYSEVITSVFAEEGERVVANKVDGVRPYLRKSLIPGLQEALAKNVRNKDLLGLKEIKLFEIGTVWRNGSEEMVLGTISEKQKSDEKLIEPAVAEVYESLPTSTTERCQPYSKYPFIVRDIAMWVPAGTSEEEVLGVIRENAGELLVRSALFDRFEKQGRVSYAFRLVFQSFDRTLIDDDANSRMQSVTAAVKEKGWEVR